MMIITTKKNILSPTVLIITATLLVALSVLFLKHASSAEVVSGWRAGNIMDDAVMANKSTMSTDQIQAFLNDKVPTCDTTGQQLSEYGGPDLNGDGKVQRWEWGKANYNQTTFTCLRDYKENNLSSAQIIYNAAQKYNINPQVLIVLLQKEQGLIQDTWPLSVQYKTATGYGCPDTAPCDSDYYGLTNQVNWSATMFRAILNNNPNWYTPYVLGKNYIQYNPSASCGGSTVTVENRATQALYNYTPYQPNQAALDAGWGSAPCGAYGNRNFYLYFTAWFGSPTIIYDMNFETLSGTSGAINNISSQNLGNYTETISSGKNIYTFYCDASNKALRLSHWDGSKWSDGILDGLGSTVKGAVKDDVGYNITAVEWSGQIQVFYYNATTKSLRHAWLLNDQWTTETLDGTSAGVSGVTGDYGRPGKVLVWNGQLQIYYYDASSKSIRHAWWSNNQWKFETLDGTSQSVSKYDADVGGGNNISAITWNGQIQLYYYDTTTQSVRHAWWSNNQWKFETFDGESSSPGRSTDDLGKSISATPYGNQLQLYYHDATTGSLKHAWWPGDGKWHFETFDGESTIDSSTTVLGNYINAGEQVLVRVIDNNLFVFYYDNATGFSDHTSSWRLAYWKNGTWNQTVLDGGYTTSQSGSSEAVGGQITVTAHSDKSVQAFYKNSGGALEHLWFSY